MTTFLRPPPYNAPFEQKVAYYRSMSRMSPWVLGGREARAVGRRWLRENNVSPRTSPNQPSKRKYRSVKSLADMEE